MARPSIYGELAERIRQAVLLYHDGWEIPSVRSLARLHGAAPDTIRKALRLLVARSEIASRGPACRYVRCRRHQGEVFCKPYPAVAVLSFHTLPFCTDGYLCRLLAGLFSGLHERRLATTILARPEHLDISLVPGGIAVRPAELRFSAAVLVMGAPRPTLAAMVQTGAIVMTLDYVADVPGVDSVAVDCEDEANAIVEHLARLGHVHIGFLAARYAVGPAHWDQGTDPDAIRFSTAMLRAKTRAGINPSPMLHRQYLLDAALSDTAVRLAVDRLWRLEPPPTALVCFDAFAGRHAREALRQRGLRCPADVSIVVRDCINPGPPPFTVLASDPHQIGEAAAGQLLDRLTNPKSVPRKLQFPSTLIDGPSTGPAPLRAAVGAHAGTRPS